MRGDLPISIYASTRLDNITLADWGSHMVCMQLLNVQSFNVMPNENPTNPVPMRLLMPDILI